MDGWMDIVAGLDKKFQLRQGLRSNELAVSSVGIEDIVDEDADEKMNTMINPPNETKSYSCIRLANTLPYAYFSCHSIPSIQSEGPTSSQGLSKLAISPLFVT